MTLEQVEAEINIMLERLHMLFEIRELRRYLPASKKIAIEMLGWIHDRFDDVSDRDEFVKKIQSLDNFTITGDEKIWEHNKSILEL